MLNLDLKDKNQIYQLIAGIVGVAAILIGCIVILSPFFPAILLATILTLSTWPAFMWLNHRLRYRTALSSFLMTLFLAVCFIVPLFIIGTSSADNFSNIFESVDRSLQGDLSDTTNMIGKIPYIGENLQHNWIVLTSDKERMAEVMKEYGGSTSSALIKMGGSIGRGLVDLTLGIMIAYFFFRYGSRVAVRINNLITTFGGERGQRLMLVTKDTLIGVVYGILGTALAQGLVAAIGFWIAKVPGASFLGLITFFLSFLPFGPPLVWVPVTFWLFSEGHEYMGLFMLCWGLFAISSIDNVLRPYFISLGSDLPFLLVLLGVLGGIAAYGFIGIFIGPTLLALAQTLVIEWSHNRTGKAGNDFATTETGQKTGKKSRKK